MRTILTAAIIATVAVTGAIRAQNADPGGSAAGVYTPPACEGLFTDVPCTAQFATWVEQLYRDGITSGCASGLYCPDSPVTRRQMSVFLERAMRGTAAWQSHTMLVFAVRAANGSPDPMASAQALRNAVAAIPTTGTDVPSASNPWLLRIGPGHFNLGTTTLVLPAWVDVEGAGEGATVLEGDGDNSEFGRVKAGANTVMRNLAVTVSCTGKNYSWALEVRDNPARLEHVTLRASGGAATSIGLFVVSAAAVGHGVVVEVDAAGSGTAAGVATTASGSLTLDSSSITAMGGARPAQGLVLAGDASLQDVRVTASSTDYSRAVNISSGSVRVIGSELRATGTSGTGMYCWGSASATIASSVVEGSSQSVHEGASATVRVGGSELAGGAAYGPVTCASVWDESGVSYPSTCP